MAKKREYGEGSIYKTQADQWFASIPLGNGKRKTVRAKSEADAKAKLKALIRDRDAGINLSVQTQTVKAFMEKWIDEVVTPNVKPKTLLFYKQMMNWYILPAIGNVRLQQVEPTHVLRLVNDLRKKLSPRTVRHAHNTAKIAFNVALKWGYINRNVFTLVDAPRVPNVEQLYLTVEEARRLLAAVAGHNLELLYLMVLTLGLRKGESLGIRWCDVDFNELTVRIAQQIQDVDGKIITDTPKTEAGVRVLPLPRDLVQKLQARQQHANSSELIFPSRANTPMQPHRLHDNYKQVLKRAELSETFKFHSLRHSAATYLSGVGASEVVIAAVLGHSRHSGPITRIYTHATMTQMRAAVEAVYALLTEKSSDNLGNLLQND